MKLQFKTRLSNIGRNEKPCFIASPIVNGTIDADVLAIEVAGRLGTSKALVKAILDETGNTIAENLRNGHPTMIDNLLWAGLKIKGTFASKDAPWTQGKNFLLPDFRANGVMKESVDGIEFENVTKGAKVQISRVLDALAHIPDVLTVGQKALLSGQGMLVDTEAEDEGVWLENAEGVKVAEGTITNRTDTTLDCTFAEWPEPGAYRICVASRGGLGEQYGVAVAKRGIEVVAGE